MSDQARGAQFWLAAIAAVFTALLTLCAFWLSYAHLAFVARGHGLGSDHIRAWAWPACLDCFIVVGEALILRASLARRIDWWAIGLTVAGAGGSIALNVAGVGSDAAPLDYVVAAVPPVAALLAFGALMNQVYRYLAARQAPPTDLPEGGQSQNTGETAEDTPEDEQHAEDAVPAEPRLMTSSEVAERYGVDPSTVRGWVAKGRLQPADRDARGRNLFDPSRLPEAVS
ncbi:DUF2637 domain-containing protein [Streptomyces synnematoformans]|uniref:Helix-turn-helix domain-containing protein n=1 Tax=Streptomyces synnematoformans TaxID=415721 RepID=A0ABP5J088_9ACTN